MPAPLILQGDAIQRSLSQGRHFKDHFPRLISEIRRIPLGAFTPPAFVYRMGLPLLGAYYLKKHRRLLETHFQENYDEALSALARGFQLSPQTLYGFHAFEPLSSNLPYSLGCCSITLDKQAVKDNKPLLAYNHDFPEAFGSFLFLKRNRPVQGYANLAMGYPPLLGAIAGVNECGLAATLNHAYAKDTRPNEGIVPTLLVQAVLNQCSSVSEAVDLISQTPTTNGSMITLMNVHGDRAVMEVSATKKQMRRPKDAIDVTLNKYQTPFMEEVELPLQAQGKGIYKGHAIHEHSLKRRLRIDALSRGFKGLVDKTLLRQWLSDHEGGSGDFFTLCRHHPLTASTLVSLIISPQDLTIDVIWGPACQQGEYETHSLA